MELSTFLVQCLNAVQYGFKTEAYPTNSDAVQAVLSGRADATLGGNTVAALVGVACTSLPLDAALAGPLAAALAMAAMLALRCLHPPGGATALLAVIGGPAVHAAGFSFAF